MTVSSAKVHIATVSMDMPDSPPHVVLAPALPGVLGSASRVNTVVLDPLTGMFVVLVPCEVIAVLERKPAVGCLAFVGAVVPFHVLTMEHE